MPADSVRAARRVLRHGAAQVHRVCARAVLRRVLELERRVELAAGLEGS